MKKSFAKKSLSILLSLLMLLSVFSVAAFAVPDDYVAVPMSPEGLAEGDIWVNLGEVAEYYTNFNVKYDNGEIVSVAFDGEDSTTVYNKVSDKEDPYEAEVEEELFMTYYRRFYRVGEDLPMYLADEGYVAVPLSDEGLNDGELYVNLPADEEGNLPYSAAFVKFDGEGDVIAAAFGYDNGYVIYSAETVSEETFQYVLGWFYIKGQVLPMIYADYVALPNSAEGLADGAYYLDAAAMFAAFGEEAEGLEVTIYVKYDENGNLVPYVMDGIELEIPYAVFVINGQVASLFDGFDLLMFVKQVGYDPVAKYTAQGFVPVALDVDQLGAEGGYFYDFSDQELDEETLAMYENAFMFYNPETGVLKAVLGPCFVETMVPPEELSAEDLAALSEEELEVYNSNAESYNEAITSLKYVMAAAAPEGLDGAVTLVADAGAVEDGTVLSVTKADEAKEADLFAIVDADDVAEAIEELKEKKIEKIVAFDISLLKDGAEVEPDGAVSISMPVPAGFDAEKIVVLHILDDGTVEKVEATVKDGIITITAPSLSYYVVAQVEEAAAEEPTTEPTTEPANEDDGKTEDNTKGYMRYIKALLSFLTELFNMLTRWIKK